MMRILTLCAAIGAVWTITATSGSAATITIIRGDQVERISTAQKTRLPPVLRGTRVSMDDDALPRTTQVTGLQPIGTGGSTIWLRDTESGEIVACTVWSSGMVGRDTFRCTGN